MTGKLDTWRKLLRLPAEVDARWEIADDLFDDDEPTDDGQLDREAEEIEA